MDVEFTERLIQEVRSRPILYSSYHPDNKNNTKKWQAWKELERELNKEVIILKAKWKNLKDTFKKYKQSKLDSSSQFTKKLQNWAWADYMTFIDEPPEDYLNGTEEYLDETEETKSFLYIEPANNPTDSSEEDNKDFLAQTPEPIPQQTPKKINTRKRFHTTRSPKVRNIQKRRKILRKTKDERVDLKCDGVDLLFLGYADTFKKLSVRKQIKVKFDFAKILMEAEMSDLDDGGTPEITTHYE